MHSISRKHSIRHPEAVAVYEEHMLAGAMLDVLELTQALMPAGRNPEPS